MAQGSGFRVESGLGILAWGCGFGLRAGDIGLGQGFTLRLGHKMRKIMKENPHTSANP